MSLEEQREEFQRVLHSTQFRRAPKLQRFLSLVCEYHFTNRSRDINEFLVATEAFGKGSDFDPSQDSLVRVQAREARRRLREYYMGDGKDSKVILDIPIGSYAPVFSEVNDAPQPPWPKRVNPLKTAWLMLLVTALVCAALLFSAERQRRLWGAAAIAAPAQAGRKTPALVSRLWNRFLDSDVPTVLVVSNPSVAGECIANPAATSVSGASAEAANCPDEYTGMGEAVAINLISNLFEARNKPLIVKQSRMVNEDDVKRYNLILLGGRMVNNWTMRLGGDLSLAPGPGDMGVAGGGGESLARYQTTFDPKTRQLISDRGVIALRRYAATGHWLLFLFGKHTQGTHAAAEGSTDERFLARLRWPSKGGPIPDSFRVFVGVAVTDGIPGVPVPVALRVP